LDDVIECEEIKEEMLEMLEKGVLPVPVDTVAEEDTSSPNPAEKNPSDWSCEDGWACA
jgi:hypothetical protein